MSSLIPYMTDRHTAADWFHAGRWPDGQGTCPRCGATGDDIHWLGYGENGIRRYSCRRCAQVKGQETVVFTDWTETLFESSHGLPEVWIQIIHQWPLGLTNQQIAWALDLADETVEQACKLLDGALDETYHLDPERRLSGHVEADELYQTAEAKGRLRGVKSLSLKGLLCTSLIVMDRRGKRFTLGLEGRILALAST